MLDHVFHDLAVGFATTFGAPYEDATAVWPGTPVRDAGGSITSPGVPVSLACKVQFDAPTQAMRAAEGFFESDVRILVLSASMTAPLDSRARITVAAGRNAGTWELLTCTGDAAGIGFECRGRKI